MEGSHASVVGSGFHRVLLGLFCSGALVLAGMTVGMTQEAKTPAITQLELQGELMGFADRLASFLGQVNIDPAFRTQPVLLRDVTFTIMAAFTIASEPYPGISLLDMVVLTTLTRLIYEEHWQRQFDQLVQPALAAFRELEADIWTIAAKALTPEQQRDLRELIRAWRQVHPQQVFVAFIRFSDFTKEDLAFSLTEAKKARGLFKSVQEATQKVDDIRLLAERGMYLATRVPLLAGPTVEFWLSQWLARPEIAQLRNNVTQVSDAADRVVQQVESLPANVREERQAAIRQLMDRVDAAINLFMDRMSNEREQLMQDLTSVEAGGRGLLPEMQQTLTAGNALATSAYEVVKALDDFTSKTHARKIAAGKQPGDINDIRGLVTDASQAMGQIQELAGVLERILLSPGWEQRLPQLLQVLDRAEAEGEDFVDFTSSQVLITGTLLILVFLLGGVLAGLVYQYASRRLFGART